MTDESAHLTMTCLGIAHSRVFYLFLWTSYQLISNLLGYL